MFFCMLVACGCIINYVQISDGKQILLDIFGELGIWKRLSWVVLAQASDSVAVFEGLTMASRGIFQDD